jgi:crossover junction endodeoxyribonuclease RuvC
MEGAMNRMALRSCESEPDFERAKDHFAQTAPPYHERIVGIDPGLNVTGYAVVEPSSEGPQVIEAGVIRPSARCSAMGQRLAYLHQGIEQVLDDFPPGAVALERVHSHIKHPRTSILMAHARGVIVLAAATRGIPVFGYAAARVKKTLTGSGRAPKPQIQHAIMTELRLDRVPEPHDVADACALALCHFQVSRNSRGLTGF